MINRSAAICHPRRFVHGNGLCGSCYRRDWLSRNPEAMRARILLAKQRIADGRAATANWKHRLKKNLGIAEQDYLLLMVEQKHGCAICGRNVLQVKKRFAVDHNHQTGQRRGLLCDTCNRALGLFHDDIDTLRNAVAYLERWNT